MLVYRIEHKDTGLGPWMQSVKDGIFYQDAFGYIKEPDEMDPSIDVSGKFFGVNDPTFFIMKIRNHFILQDVFVYSTYEVEEGQYHVYPDGQVLFDKSKAIKVKSNPINDLFQRNNFL